MEPLNEADRVIRTFLPCMLEKVGRKDCARELRDTDSLREPKGVIRAAMLLHEMAQMEGSDEELPWQSIVDDALFWCEAAIWSAVEGDIVSFREHVDRVNLAMKQGLVILHSQVH